MRKRRTSRIVAAVCSCVAVAGFGASAQATHSAERKDPPQGNLPSLNMEDLLRASQLDRYRTAGSNTPGAKPDVKRVQHGLRRKGYDVSVDGSFGTQTAGAYAKWQRRSVGLKGIQANGLPDLASLRKLGKHRFQVIHPVGTGKIVSYGKPPYREPVNLRTRAMMRTVDSIVGGPNCTLSLYQGSYQGSFANSAETHRGGGAVDVVVKDGYRCGAAVGKIRRAMRRVGFAAWYRRDQDPPHIHAVAISDPDLSTPQVFPGSLTAVAQVGSWAAKEDGLSSTFGLPNKRALHTWEDFKRAHP